MPSASIQELRRTIAEAVAAHGEVLLVYLFGSRVTGDVGPLSDTDLAVLLTPGAASPAARSQLAHDFAVALQDEPVDLVLLNQAPVELAYAVIAAGEVLYQRDLVTRVEYEADVLSRYGDYLPFLRALRQDNLQGADDERRVQRYREALGRTERALGAPGAPSDETTR